MIRFVGWFLRVPAAKLKYSPYWGDHLHWIIKTCMAPQDEAAPVKWLSDVRAAGSAAIEVVLQGEVRPCMKPDTLHDPG